MRYQEKMKKTRRKTKRIIRRNAVKRKKRKEMIFLCAKTRALLCAT